MPQVTFHLGCFAQFWTHILKAGPFKLVQKIRQKKPQLLGSPFFILSEKDNLTDLDVFIPEKMGRA